MELPNCRNFEVCGNLGFVYIYGNFYCGDCVKKYHEKLKLASEKLLIEEK